MSLIDWLAHFDPRPGASPEDIEAAQAALGAVLPDDLRELLSESNGSEGFVAEGGYIHLWRTSELPALNDGYGVAEFLPGTVLFGTDGAGTGFGFRSVDHLVEYIKVPLVGMAEEDVEVLGAGVASVLQHVLEDV